MMSISDLLPAGSSTALVVSVRPMILGTGKAALLDIPDPDYDEWMRDVAKDERYRIRELFDCFREIAAARSIKAGSEAAARKRSHNGYGWSAKALRALYWAYRDGGHKPGDYRKEGPTFSPGDWRILLRAYKGKKKVLPPEFVRWLGERWTEFRGREDCVNALWRHVVQEIWLKGEKPIPGYGLIDDWCRRTGRARPHPLLIRPGELPDGWSVDTFRRVLPRRQVTRTQAALGYLAAHVHQPDQVLTDRAPLMPLQYIFIDDSRPDFRCLWLSGGRGEFVYPLLVLGLDAASGVDVANVAKPRALKSPDAENAAERKARHGVTHDMALQVVINTLRRFGLPPWQITFVHENAAGCVPDWARRFLREAFGERINFEATSVVKQRMHEHGFTESGGAPYDKAPIEAFWRILMTQLARLPGSTGPRYDTQPPDLKAIEEYTLGLVERAGGVAEIVSQLQLPNLRFEQAHAAIEDALRLLRFRSKHALQGFDRVVEWRRSPAENYQPEAKLLELPIEEQNAVTDIISRLECPAERFMRKLLGVEMTPVDDDLLTYMEGPRRTVTVRNGKIIVEAQEHGDDQLVFREENHPLLDEEYEGQEFDAAIAGDGQRIVLTQEGRVLGSVARQSRVSRADKDAMHREQARVRSARKTDRETFAGYYLADQSDALEQLRARNETRLSDPALPAPTPQTPNNGPRLTAEMKRRNIDRSRQLADAAQQQLSDQ